MSVGGGEWVGKATAYKFDTFAIVGVHSTMHLVDPIQSACIIYLHVCVCACVRVCACMPV